MFEGTQMDLFYLIGSLAFFLIGALTPILNRRTNRLLPWTWLGAFAICRGFYELLSLPALSMMMPGHFFGMVQNILLFASLIFLVEFGRAGSITADGPVPWWWVYVPLGVLILLGRLVGLAGLAGTVNFSLSFVGGAWAAYALYQGSQKLPRGKEILTAAGIFMFLYGLASGFIDSAETFNSMVGIPVHLVRAVLAIGLAACLCRVCQIAADRVMDRRTQALYQHLAFGTTIGLIFIAVVGLVGSLGMNYFSNNASKETLAKNQSTVLRIKEVINGEMEKADRLVQLLAGDTRIHNALMNVGDPTALNIANSLVDRYSQTEEGYGICYIMNLSGVTIASSNRNQPDSFIGKNFGFRPYFKQGALGLQGRYFALGTVQKELGYYTSAPARNDKGVVVGVAVIKRVIRTSGELRNAFDPDSLSFLVDPHGIAVMSSQSSYVLRSLWPLDEATTKELVESKQFGPGPFTPILEQTPVEGKDYQVAGRRMVALTQPTLMEGWTIFHFGSIQAIPFYRMLGAVAILAFGFALIGFYVSWDLASYKAANIAAVDPAQNGSYVASRQAEEELRRGELKYQMLVNNIGLLSEMGDLLQGCKSPQDVIPVISRYMERLFPDLSGGIYLASEVGDKFEVAGKWGESPPEERVFARDDCWALRRGRQYLVEDTGASLVCHHLPDDLPTGYQCWPLMAQGETLGVFHLRQGRHLSNPHNLSEQQKETTQQMISTVVDQIALTLVNLKLREASRT